MRVPRFRRAWLRSEALRRLVVECGENKYRRELLLECVEAYAELDEEQVRVYQELLQTERYKEIQPMMATTFERGQAQGQRTLIRFQLEHRFGKLDEAVLQRLNDWPVERLMELGRAVLDGKSLREIGLED